MYKPSNSQGSYYLPTSVNRPFQVTYTQNKSQLLNIGL